MGCENDEFDREQFAKTRIKPVMRCWMSKGYSVFNLCEVLMSIAEEDGDEETCEALSGCWE